MTLILGRYRWQPMVLAYRNDYCLNCDKVSVSLHRRTNDFFHVYYIPLIPLGYSRHWHCMECDQDPHERVRTGRGVKLVGAILSGIFAIVFWLLPRQPGDEVIFTSLACGGTFMGVMFWWSWNKHEPEPSLNERLQDIERIDPEVCLSCKAELEPESVYCPMCEVEYFETPGQENE